MSWKFPEYPENWKEIKKEDVFKKLINFENFKT